jgi:uncharacterized protein (TIRG00374 family)
LSTPPPASAPQPQKKRRPAWALAFGFLLAAVLLYFTLRGLDWSTFWLEIRGGQYEILLLTIPIASINYFIRALRWRILVQSQGRISALSVFWANMVGYLGNAYMPARAGELLRSAYLGQKSGSGISFVLATALTERILDVLALVLIGSVSLAFQVELSGVLLIAVRTMAVAALVGLLVVYLVPFFEAPLARLLGMLPIPAGLRENIILQFQRFLVGMRSLQSLRRFCFFTLLTTVIWLIDGLGNMLGVQIIGQSLSLGQALIFLAALGLSSAIPSTPGYVGVYQFVAVAVLVPFGFTKADALAYILISQVINYLVVTFWGLIGLWQVNRAKVSSQ